MKKWTRICFVALVCIPILCVLLGVMKFVFDVYQIHHPFDKNRELAEICQLGNKLNQADIDKAGDLLDHGANADQSYGGLQPTLLEGVLYGASNMTNRVYCNELIELLLQHGADPNQQRDDIGSFLHYAVGHIDTEKILLQYGARVSTSAEKSPVTFTGKTILELATENYNDHKKGSSLEEVKLLQQALDEENKTKTKL